MSGHLIGCVRSVAGLGKSHKLALIAFADSADDRTHIAFPGYSGVQEWADCSRSRAAELIADLVTAGYLALHKSSRPGRRAEYVVFPDGCCDLHRTPADDTDHIPDITPEVALQLLRRAGLAPADTSRAAASNGSGTSDVFESEKSDPSSGNRSETPDPSPTNTSEKSDPSIEQVQNGSEISDPCTSSSTSPPSPRKRGATSCHRHPDTPGTNCRVCGTTDRQQAEKRQAAAAQARRAADARAVADARAAKAAAAPPPRGLLAQTRDQIQTRGATR